MCSGYLAPYDRFYNHKPDLLPCGKVLSFAA